MLLFIVTMVVMTQRTIDILMETFIVRLDFGKTEVEEKMCVNLVLRVPTRPRSRVPMAPIKSQPLVTPVTDWSEMRVVHVLLLHMPFKATTQSVKTVRQGLTPTPVLAPPAPRVILVL